ncbi:MAG: hypothetical protein K2F57_03420, partial [Candidatus Gastranaerophilales bacterium]|nr:hypothetical protein [Candidatus Gastranaerophilales bacterium]
TEVLNKKEKQPYLTRIKLIQTPDKNGNRHETQTIEELSANKHRKYIKTTAKRSISGILYNKTLEGNTGNLNRLRKSKYLYFLNYSLKDFLNSIFPYAQKLQKVKNKEILYTFEPLQGNISGSSNTVADTGILKFDLTKEFSKYAVVRLVNHELRHQYQDLMISKFKQKGLKGFIARIIHPFKYSYSKQCEESFKNYIPSSVDYKKYLKNYVEIDARAAAMTANQEYLKEMFF